METTAGIKRGESVPDQRPDNEPIAGLHGRGDAAQGWRAHVRWCRTAGLRIELSWLLQIRICWSITT